jgi:hypothetical protein
MTTIARPNRLGHTYTQTLDARPDKVFPLLCPVRELEWTRGWDPSLILSNSGVAEADCVFTTSSQRGETVWMITRHDSENHEVEMILVTPGSTVAKLEIALEEKPAGKTAAKITYTHTSLGPEGDLFLKSFTRQWYENFMLEWQKELNHFLSTNEKLA